MRQRLAAFLNLAESEVASVTQFWLFYATLNMMLQLGENLSMSLFLKRVGLDYLPLLYISVALINVVFSTTYTFVADRMSNRTLFFWVISLSGIGFLGTTLLAMATEQGPWFLLVNSLFFIVRESSFTLLIMHFGLYLRDCFSRSESERTFPVIYASGRFGGLLAGLLIGSLAPMLGTLALTFIYPLLAGLCIAFLSQIHPSESAAVKMASKPSEGGPEKENLFSLKQGWLNFIEGLHFVRQSKLLLVMSAATALFVFLRYFLNLEYSSYFNKTFHNEDELSSFLGYYSTIALAVATCIQLLLTSRLVQRIGVGGVNLMFSIAMGGSFWLLLLLPSFGSAVACRFIETELRMSFRNPVMNMFYNAVPDQFRARARAFTFGMVLPTATLAAGGFLQLMQGHLDLTQLALFGAAGGLVFILFSWQQAVAYDRASQESMIPSEQALAQAAN